MPQIPFLSNFNEKISGAAVRFHLKSALRKSHSIGELKRTLEFKLQKGEFNNATKQAISNILSKTEQAQQSIVKDLQNEQLKPQATQPTPQDNLATQAQDFSQAKHALESAQAQPAPAELNKAELESILNQFDNVENIKKHFVEKPDEKQRYALFSLLQDTMLDPLIKYTSAGKTKYLQKFSTGKQDEPFFYLLVTQDRDKTFITHFKTRDTEYLLKDIENASEVIKGADLIGKFTSWGGNSNAIKPTSTNQINGNNQIIANSNPQEAQNTYKSLFELAKADKEAKAQAELAKKQADSEYIAQLEARKKARIDKIKAEQKASQGETTLEARAKIKANQMGEPIPYQRLADTHIILEDTTYPAEFVLINKQDLKPSFEAGGFQTREVKQDDKIAKIRDNFDPLKIFGKIGEYDGLPLIAKNGEIITGNHRGEAIKQLSGENLAKFKEYAKKYFGIDLSDEQIIVRRILDDTENENGATLIEQIALAARSNKGSERTLGEQATAALGEYKDKIAQLQANPSRRFIESESVDNQKSAVARLLGAELKEDEANLALLASLSKASYNLDIAKALDLIQGNDLLKGKIKNMLISNAGGFYNISNSLELPKLNEITNYLVDAIAYLGKSTAENPNATSINRSEAYRDLTKKILDRVNGVQSFETMQTPLPRFIQESKSDVLGATLAKFANQDFASQRLYEALKEMPDVLIDRFTNASFDFFGNGGYKPASEIDIYDFLDYLVGKGQQNEATSALKDALIALKKLESSQTPPPTNSKKSPSLAQADKGGGYQSTPEPTPQPTEPSPKNTPQNTPSEPTPKPQNALDSSTKTPRPSDNLIQNDKKLKKALESAPHFRQIFDDVLETSGQRQYKARLEEKEISKILNGKGYTQEQVKNAEIMQRSNAKNLASETELQQFLYDFALLKDKTSIDSSLKHQYYKNKQTEKGKFHFARVLREKEKNYLNEYFLRHLGNLRQAIQSHYNISPAQEFGYNYAEFYRDGAGGIQKLLAEANAAKQVGQDFSGQVAGAFYREDLGDITLAYGDSNFGLKHILERRTQDFQKQGLSQEQAEQKALEFIEQIPEIIEKSKLKQGQDGAFLVYDNALGVIALDYKGDKTNKWILTAYERKNADSLSPAYQHQSLAHDPKLQLDLFKVGSSSTDSTTKTSNFSKIYKKREAIQHEINELKESYFTPRVTTNYEPQTPPKIEFLSEAKRRKIELQMEDLKDLQAQLTRELYASHKILKDLHAQGKAKQILDTLATYLQNPNLSEHTIKYKAQFNLNSNKGVLSYDCVDEKQVYYSLKN